MVANISDSNTTNRLEKESEVNVMDMCYDGTLVLPSSYAVMDEEEMIYLEGGGTVRVIASKSTVRTICRAGVALLSSLIAEAFGGPILARLISGALSTLVFDFILDRCGYKYKAIDAKFTRSIFPNVTFNVNKYV